MDPPSLVETAIRARPPVRRVSALLAGKTVLVTGATSGIGRETARALAAQGARVVGAVRDPTRLDAGIEGARVDLASLRDVRRFAAEFRSSHDKLHALVNNAGFHTARRTLTVDGFESTFAVNHLAHFLLVRELMSQLVASAPSRVVTVASEAHRGGSLAFLDDHHAERSWSGLRAYANSKLANILFTRELARRASGSGVSAFAVHPGSVRTGWARGKESGMFRVGVALASPFLKSPQQGARTSFDAVTRDDLPNGCYLTPRGVTEPSKAARDQDAARRLWELSEQMLSNVGIR
jgi:NAD(P)-dependent dehydrogenase (short-subunit alcohol dehydrogenase family)